MSYRYHFEFYFVGSYYFGSSVVNEMSDESVTLQKVNHWYMPFLDQLRQVPNVTVACDKAGVSRQTAYRHREEDESFKTAWDAAIDEAVERLEYEMHRRAYEGIDHPVIHQGEITTTYKEYSDTLAIFLAKAHRPEKYRERQEIKLDGELNIKVSYEGEE